MVYSRGEMESNSVRETIEAIFPILDKQYGDAPPLLHFQTPFELLIAVILTSQTTDAAVNRITPQLFARYPTPEVLAKAPLADLQRTLHPIGLYKRKSLHIRTVAAKIQERGGSIPESMEDLLTLPGVGRKTANVIRALHFNKPAIIVDTHFGRVCRRIGLTQRRDPTLLERELTEIVTEKIQTPLSMAINRHGRQFCQAVEPLCSLCPIRRWCHHYALVSGTAARRSGVDEDSSPLP